MVINTSIYSFSKKKPKDLLSMKMSELFKYDKKND
jgi:hypothetical protein